LAFIAIAVKQWQLNHSIAITAIAGAIVLFIAIASTRVQKQGYFAI
jgi:hypothetical protein